jgi:hypothetical protein
MLIAFTLAWAWGIIGAQEVGPAPLMGPPFAEVEAKWNAFWAGVADGDLAAAGRYVHSSRRDLPSSGKALSELQNLAHQMAFCQLDPTPFPLASDQVVYRVRCRHGAESAETVIIIRQDADGKWRLIPY